MKILGIIPARYQSSRFPGKPLVDIKGKSMIQRVVEQARLSKLKDDVFVATDDDRIIKHCKDSGINVVLTSDKHQSGTDRCYEAYENLKQKANYIINIQGDEPFLDPNQINELLAHCDGKNELLTQMIPITSQEHLTDFGEVKIVLNEANEAIYFSRSPIPFIKDKPISEWIHHFQFYRHVGMYVYRTDCLEQISKMKPGKLEMAESLEQLRWLENGLKIKCVETKYESHCIDTPEDLQKVFRNLN
ncbi:MAG: 3-deoxy-manno-octulosonate cytidylyltransferase [Bacteroidia bacterium]